MRKSRLLLYHIISIIVLYKILMNYKCTSCFDPLGEDVGGKENSLKPYIDIQKFPFKLQHIWTSNLRDLKTKNLTALYIMIYIFKEKAIFINEALFRAYSKRRHTIQMTYDSPIHMQTKLQMAGQYTFLLTNSRPVWRHFYRHYIWVEK